VNRGTGSPKYSPVGTSVIENSKIERRPSNAKLAIESRNSKLFAVIVPGIVLLKTGGCNASAGCYLPELPAGNGDDDPIGSQYHNVHTARANCTNFGRKG